MQNTRHTKLKTILFYCVLTSFKNDIVSRVNKGFSILADETTDIFGIEQLSLGVRFIESAPKPVIREEFLGFTAIEGS